MFFSSIKEINRLTSNGMLNICKKDAIEKNWRSQNFDFLSLKDLSPGQFLWRSHKYHWILKLVVTKSQRSGSKTVWLFYYFVFERNYDALKSKSSWVFLNKNITLNQNKTESKSENATLRFREAKLVLQLI